MLALFSGRDERDAKGVAIGPVYFGVRWGGAAAATTITTESWWQPMMSIVLPFDAFQSIHRINPHSHGLINIAKLQWDLPIVHQPVCLLKCFMMLLLIKLNIVDSTKVTFEFLFNRVVNWDSILMSSIQPFGKMNTRSRCSLFFYALFIICHTRPFTTIIDTKVA